MVWEPGKPDADEIVPWFGGVFKEARSKDDAFDRICAQFESWMKDGRAKTLHESTFQQTYQYDRILYPGPYFGTRPFFCVMAEVPSDKNQEFSDWYGNKYLPQLLADVPYFTGCRRYADAIVDPEAAPQRQLTLYTAEDENRLTCAVAAIRAPHRYESNQAWTDWSHQFSEQHAGMFRPVYFQMR
eukprot:jgi/Chrzof1/10431/UNPLg00358.t1